MLYIVNTGFKVNGTNAGEAVELNGTYKSTKKLLEIGAIKK